MNIYDFYSHLKKNDDFSIKKELRQDFEIPYSILTLFFEEILQKCDKDTLISFMDHRQFKEVLDSGDFIDIITDSIPKGRRNVMHLLSSKEVQDRILNDSIEDEELINLFNIINRTNKIEKIKECINDKSRI